MPNVTEAHLGEAGVPPRRPRSRATAATVAAVAATSPVAPAAHPHPATPRKGLFGRATDFLRAS